MTYTKKNKGIKKGGSNKCTRQLTKKYRTRPSPPFPANKCKNKKKIGNDKKYYKSTKNKAQIYRWELI